MTRYKEYVKKMLDENKDLFASFRKIHDLYSQDDIKWQEQLNKDGEKVREVVREYENRLCRNTEQGQFNVYSPKLAEKFQDEVRKHFPYIDHIGLKVEDPQKDNFEIKKINLS